MHGARDTFLLHNVRVSTVLVFLSVRIGHPPVQLSIVIKALLCSMMGRQSVPLISVYIQLPYPACRGSHFIWIHHVLPLVPPVIDFLRRRNRVKSHLGVQSMTLIRLVLLFASHGVRMAMVVPGILAFHGSTGVTLSLRGLGSNVHILGLRIDSLSEDHASVTG